jgi:hypothetical protein
MTSAGVRGGDRAVPSYLPRDLKETVDYPKQSQASTERSR